MEKNIIHVSILSIVKFFLVILVFYFLYLIKSIIGIVFVALILSSAVDPWVDKLQSKKIPRGISVLLFYVVLLLVLLSVAFFLIPPVAYELGQLADTFPVYFEKLSQIFSNAKAFSAEHGLLEDFDNSIKALRDSITGMFDHLFNTVAGILTSIASFFIVLVITFYMTVQEDAIKKSLRFLVPDKFQPFVVQLINKTQKKIGSWLKGQLILSLIMGVVAYIGFLILGVKFALLLAILVALAEFIPYVGPVLAAIPALLLAFLQSPITALFVLIFFIVLQQVENNILVPKVMQKVVGLNPIISIIALLIGAKIGGVVGVILAIPVATAIAVITKELWAERETLEEIKEEA